MDIRGFFQRWGLFLGIGAAVFFVAWFFIGRKNAKTATTSGAVGATSDVLLPGQQFQSGANGQPTTIYVPTTGDTYENINYSTNSNNVTQGPGSANQGGTVTPAPVVVPPVVVPPVTVPPPPPPIITPPPKNPPPPPPPPPHRPAYQTYTIVHGDTLSHIASKFHTTWQNLYTLNKSTVDKYAAQHNNPIPGGPWNNIFPGEKINVPVT